MTALLAALHHIAVVTLLGCTLMSIVRWRQPFDLSSARRLRAMDRLNGMAATLILLVGLVRVLYFEKGAAYYFHNGPFIAKLTVYGLASVLSLVPTLEMVRWRVPLKQRRLPSLSPQKLTRLRRVAHLQLGCLVAMMVCANLAARGVDTAAFAP
jgi:putative membrane protein